MRSLRSFPFVYAINPIQPCSTEYLISGIEYF